MTARKPVGYRASGCCGQIRGSTARSRLRGRRLRRRFFFFFSRGAKNASSRSLAGRRCCRRRRFARRRDPACRGFHDRSNGQRSGMVHRAGDRSGKIVCVPSTATNDACRNGRECCARGLRFSKPRSRRGARSGAARGVALALRRVRRSHQRGPIWRAAVCGPFPLGKIGDGGARQFAINSDPRPQPIGSGEVVIAELTWTRSMTLSQGARSRRPIRSHGPQGSKMIRGG